MLILREFGENRLIFAVPRLSRPGQNLAELGTLTSALHPESSPKQQKRKTNRESNSKLVLKEMGATRCVKCGQCMSNGCKRSLSASALPSRPFHYAFHRRGLLHKRLHQAELGPRPVQIVPRSMDLKVPVAFQIVGKKTNPLLRG